jgi:LysM repeat protein
MASSESMSSPMASAPITFDPNAPAVASSSGGGSRYNPTRPNTAVASTLVAPPVTDVTPATTYVVKSGDTLWELGKKFRVPYAEIASANNIRASAPLHAGQKLIIPGRATTTAATAPAATTPAVPAVPAPAPTKASASGNANAVKHIVKPNETLSMIARTYGVRQGEIAVANNISDPQKIRAGTELIIPGWEATGAARSTPRSSNPRSVDDAAKAAPAQNAPRPIINILDAEPAAPAAQSPNDVPVIQVDENPMTSSPRSN